MTTTLYWGAWCLLWFIVGLATAVLVASNPRWRLHRWLNGASNAVAKKPKWQRQMAFGLFVFVLMGPFGLVLAALIGAWKEE